MSTNGVSNGAVRNVPLRAGVYAPIITTFDPTTEDLDLTTQTKHALRLAKGGLAGLVIHGTNGEAVHQTKSERSEVIRAIRTALDDADFHDFPVIAGCSWQSTRGTIELCQDAARSGASYAIILPPCYYKPAMTNEVLHQFYTDVADKSPIPILMYNFPSAAAGMDMDSDLMIKIAKHPNVKGAKFTCANTGKLTRLAAATNAISFKSSGSGFLATGGLGDMIVQSMVSGGSGVVAGSANVLPKVCVRVWNLCVQGKIQEAMELQKWLADADWVLTKSGISGTKAALHTYYGYGGYTRKPLQRLSAEQSKDLTRSISDIVELENSL
ncbi:MAG: hypothetical protein M1831_000171 [Alyxoria varia]|nr:MAG: hypothetical protein M1831_000171 [Alyxoria varia]